MNTKESIEQIGKQPAIDSVQLRDYFAAKAMAAFFASPVPVIPSSNTPDETMAFVALKAYCAADAMLKARES